jgi:hypothetical protein
MIVEKTEYGGWTNCWRITNGLVDAVVTGDVGPRVMRFGFVGGQNFFKEFAGQMGRSGESTWQPRGGHRLWMGPEDVVRTYALDNGPVSISADGGMLAATSPVEAVTGLEKRIALSMAPTGGEVEVAHTLRNAGTDPVELAPWALTMLTPGGVGIHPFPPRRPYPEALAVSAPLVMWAYTDFTDPRWKLLRKYLVLRQDPRNSAPQKAGSFNQRTRGAYLLNDELFVKRSEAPGTPAAYTDNGCSFETFTNADFLELETLGSVVRLEPGNTVTHTEWWSVHAGVQVDEWTDDGLDLAIGALLG